MTRPRNRMKSFSKPRTTRKQPKLVLFSTELSHNNILRRDTILRLIRNIRSPKNSSVLEIGIGNGRYGILLAPLVKEYVGIDQSKEYVNEALRNMPTGANVKYIVGKGEAIPLNRKFNVILCGSSWHFMTNFSKTLDGFVRTLQPNGLVIIVEPTEKSNWASTALQQGHPDFSPAAFAKKMIAIRNASTYLQRQRKMKIVKVVDLATNERIWMLQKISSRPSGIL